MEDRAHSLTWTARLKDGLKGDFEDVASEKVDMWGR